MISKQFTSFIVIWQAHDKSKCILTEEIQPEGVHGGVDIVKDLHRNVKCEMAFSAIKLNKGFVHPAV